MFNNVNGYHHCGCLPPTNNYPGAATISQEQGFGGQMKTVIDAGAGNDNINVHTNRNGSVDVTINGQKYHFSREQAKNLEIRGGAGDDVITCSSSNHSGLRGVFERSRQAENHITLNGGDGNDTISGGKGNEVIMAETVTTFCPVGKAMISLLVEMVTTEFPVAAATTESMAAVEMIALMEKCGQTMCSW